MTLITIYGYRGMLVCVARSIPTVIPIVINIYLAMFSRSEFNWVLILICTACVFNYCHACNLCNICWATKNIHFGVVLVSKLFSGLHVTQVKETPSLRFSGDGLLLFEV